MPCEVCADMAYLFSGLGRWPLDFGWAVEQAQGTADFAIAWIYLVILIYAVAIGWGVWWWLDTTDSIRGERPWDDRLK